MDIVERLNKMQKNWKVIPFSWIRINIVKTSMLPKVKVLVTQLCPTLFNPIYCSPLAPLSMEFSR